MKLKINSGFTLIELLIVISIISIMVLASYIPYSHYQNKLLLKQGVKEISQSISEARNMAINGIDNGSGNLSIGLYFDSSDLNKNYIKYYSFPYYYSGSLISLEETEYIKVIKNKKLPLGVEVDKISDNDSFLFLFNSISGSGEYFYFDDNGIKKPFSDNNIKINISFKNSTSPILQKEIDYYTISNIIDY